MAFSSLLGHRAPLILEASQSRDLGSVQHGGGVALAGGAEGSPAADMGAEVLRSGVWLCLGAPS